jgi:predicted DNA binding CopG/RHH family protein
MPGKKPIPDFKTEKEEQEFWATHSSLDYDMELVADNFEIDDMAKTQPISIRMEKWLLRDLKEIAAEEGLPYQTIIKECLKRLVNTRQQRKAASASAAS